MALPLYALKDQWCEKDSLFLQSMMENKVLSTLGHDLMYNRLDNVMDSMCGYSFWIINYLRGLGGGSGALLYFSNTMSAGYCYLLIRNNQVILNMRRQKGYILKLNRPLHDRYSLEVQVFGSAKLVSAPRIMSRAIVSEGVNSLSVRWR